MFLFNKQKLGKIQDILKDINGIFLTLTALLIFTIVCIVAFAIDIKRISFIQNHIQNSIDSAVLSGCANLTTGILDQTKTELILRKHAHHFIEQGLGPEKAQKIAQSADVSVQSTHIPMQYKVILKSTYQLEPRDFILGSLIRVCFSEISCISTGMVQRDSQKTALSLNMVLDVSNSMNKPMTTNKQTKQLINYKEYQPQNLIPWEPDRPPKSKKSNFFKKNHLKTLSKRPPPSIVESPNSKLSFLKQASKTLVDILQDSTKNNPKALVRIGVIAYNDKIDRIIPLSNNFSNIKKEIDQLRASDDTNSYPAMKSAYNYLQPETSERKAHNISQNESLKKYIIFMSDGKNNHPLYGDSYTEEICKLARENGITIYTVYVDADADQRGERLLRTCASSDNNFYLVKKIEELADCFRNIAFRIQQKKVQIIPN
ncbi:VWA domain-containing protein [Candidatus Liberibacter solanacearum]|uniref:VWA domain-containing protein n=1 Tax=Candidatus Liberibacter solanacearum TaxID=556287 RepID=UPI00387DC3DE